MMQIETNIDTDGQIIFLIFYIHAELYGNIKKSE